MKRIFLPILLFYVGVIACWGQAAVEVASQRYPIIYEQQTIPFPYESSHNLSETNEAVVRVLFVIHSASYDATQYYSNGLSMLEHIPREKDKTLIITPHFLKTDQIEHLSSPDFLYWKTTPFWGSSLGFYQGRDVRISAYEVVDQMLEAIVKSGHFPHLREIVVMGHSAGGQMANRYAACNVFEEQDAKPNDIRVKYVVMAPSSYVYFSSERPVQGSLAKFDVPENAEPRYNQWGYGLDNLYSYHRRNRITGDRIIENYSNKCILYLVGSKDNNPEENTLDKGVGAMLQGPNRLVRGRLYYNYLRHFYGDAIQGHQYFRIVKGAGHYGKALMTSPECVKFVFEYEARAKKTEGML